MSNDVQETINRVSGLEYRIVEQVKFLSDLTARRSKTGARYAFPSQQWLATKFGVRRETVNRHMRRLWRLGVMNVTHRRKCQGRWMTNLYTIVQSKYWAVVRMSRVLCGWTHRVTKKSHIAPIKRENSIKDSERLAPEVAKQGFALIFAALDHKE